MYDLDLTDLNLDITALGPHLDLDLTVGPCCKGFIFALTLALSALGPDLAGLGPF